MFRIIIIYELVFIVFWNLLYQSNSGVENWFTEKFLTALFVFLSTMALSVTLVYIIYLTAKASGFVKTLKKIKDPRLGNN